MTNDHSSTILERMLKKGRDFDVGAVKDDMNKLLSLEGLFDLNDIADRLPIELSLIKSWHRYPNSRYRECFVKIPVGPVRHQIFIDLQLLNKKLKESISIYAIERK